MNTWNDDDRRAPFSRLRGLRRLRHGILLMLIVAGCTGNLSTIGDEASTTPSAFASTAPTSTAPMPTATTVASAGGTPSFPAGPTSRPSQRPQATPGGTLPAPTPQCRPTAPGSTKSPAVDSAALAVLVGQKLVVRMDGTTPDQDLLNRVASGQIGGVILFGSNVTTPAALTALTARLQTAAAGGGQPPLLIATDQEGGTVSRVPWAPPTLSAPEMGVDGRPWVARDQGSATASALAGLGINVDLAPVADVPASATSFIYLQHRTFSFDAATTATLATAFAVGLESSGVVPVMKHFPGLGLATANTDSHAVVIAAPRSALEPGLAPYRASIAAGLRMVMLSNATYAALDPCNGAGWSSAVGNMLRQELGFVGVTITDSLTGTALASGTTDAKLAVRAAMAGTDLILVTGNEASSRAVYSALLEAAAAGIISPSTLDASNARIAALKAGL